jgi:hypothetical protein
MLDLGLSGYHEKIQTDALPFLHIPGSRREVLERIPVMFEHSRHGERNFCILAG